MRNWQRIMSVAGVASLVTGGAQAFVNLQITEVYEGSPGNNVTEDWVEITNFGTTTYTFGGGNELYYDDESADPTKDERVTGIADITPGESVVVVLANSTADVDDFVNAWGASNLVGVEIGYLIGDNPGGLSRNGEPLFFYDGNTPDANEVMSAVYIGTNNSGIPGSTWISLDGDGVLATQSVDGVNGAFTALVAAGDIGQFPLVGSPGVVPEPTSLALLGLGGLMVLRRRRNGA